MSTLIPAKPADKLLAICIYLLVVWQFFENQILIYAKHNAQVFYPFAFSFKYLILLLGFVPRVPRLKLKVSTFAILFIGLSVYAVVISTEPISQVAASARDLTLFAFLFYMLSSINLSNRYKILYRVMKIIMFMAIVNVLCSTYIVYTNDGTPKDFYFYSYLVSIDRWRDFNYFRNGSVRAFGLFVSPITYSNFLILPLSHQMARLLVRPTLPGVLLLLVLLIGLWQTQTRNPPLALILALLMYIIWQLFKRFYLILICHLCALTFSAYGLHALYQAGLLEPSSAGRVEQTQQLLPTILNNWSGFGFGAFGAQFTNFSDLSILTVFLTFGLFGGICYYYLVFVALYRLCQYHTYFTRIVSFTWFSKVNFTTLFITINALLIVSINSNVFDSIVLPLIAIVAGLYYSARGLQHKTSSRTSLQPLSQFHYSRP
jgi:hypothetical protein